MWRNEPQGRMGYQEKEERQNRAKNHTVEPSSMLKSRGEKEQLKRPLKTMTVFHSIEGFDSLALSIFNNLVF